MLPGEWNDDLHRREGVLWGPVSSRSVLLRDDLLSVRYNLL